MSLDVPQVVAMLRRLPDTARRFGRTEAEAAKLFHIDGDLLAGLVAAGLPHLPSPDGPLFDPYDLTNVSLCLLPRSPQRVAMRCWARMLNQPAENRLAYEVTYVPSCPAPGHHGDCPYTFQTLDGPVHRTARADGMTPMLTVAGTLERDLPPIPPRLVELCREMADVQFVRLPGVVRWDTDLLRRHRIGDCAAFSNHLVLRGTELGLRMRTVFGLIVSAPFSTQHYWAEVWTQGRWLAADPGMVTAMRQWSLLPDDWPEDRSTGTFLVRLSTDAAYLASHGGLASDVSLRTRVTRS